LPKKIVVLENVKSCHRIWIFLWRILGYRLYYLHALLGVSQKSWFQKLTKEKKLEKLFLRTPLYIELNPAADRAFSLVESLYDIFFQNSIISRQVERLFESADIHLAFKKNLNEELVDVFYCMLLQERIEEALRGIEISEVFLVPEKRGLASRWKVWVPHLRKRNQISNSALSFSFPFWVLLTDCFDELGARCKTLAVWGYVGIHLLHNMAKKRSKVANNKFLKYAIAIYSPLREFANPIRRFDFLLDGVHIRKENTLFVSLARLAPSHKQFLNKEGYQFDDLTVAPSFKTFKSFCSSIFFLFYSIVFEAEWVSRTYVGMLRAFCTWNDFLKEFPVSNFISYCDFGFGHIGRNIILRKGGVHTWFYVDTVNGPDNFPVSEKGLPFRQHIYGFLMYDTFISWCERHARWNKMLHQRIGRYINVGSLWSEHIRLIKEGRLPSAFHKQLNQAGFQKDMKIVSVFDSWFFERGIIQSKDLLAFLQDLMALLRDFDNIFLVIKEKKSRWFFSLPYFPKEESGAIYNEYEEFERHPRCLLPGHNANPSEIVAVSDLVIAFPFTSVGVEALGARCKAVYYDPLSRFRGSANAAIPDLVAHGYPDLQKLVSRYLYEISNDAYEQYLETRARGDIEPFLDGLGITRFRKLLAE